VKIAGPVKVGHLVQASLSVGSAMRKLRSDSDAPNRWENGVRFVGPNASLVQIQSQEQDEAR
jgi:hypothetical protein